MRIGIYGGSFNPVHKGHTLLAESLVSQGLVDEVWLLVSPLNPLKQEQSADIVAYEHRLAMATLATEDTPGIRVSDFESRMPVPSYMVNTLAALQAEHPDHDFSLVIGADNWMSFPRWHRADDIISKFRILVYRRPGCHIDESSLPPSVHVVNTPLFDISSTRIRTSIAEGTPLTQWIDAKVVQYIESNGLYR